MTTMNISLMDFIDGRLQEGGYGTASEYVRELIRNDQKSTALASLALLTPNPDE